MDISYLVTEVTDLASKTLNSKDRNKLSENIKQLETAWKSESDTMDISYLVTEVTDLASKTVNAKDRRDLLYHIVDLETALESGESTEAKRHALSILRVAKKYSKKMENRNRLSDASIQLLESISTGNYVQQRRASSARPDLAFEYSLSEQHTHKNKKYDEPQKKHDEMWNRYAVRSLKLMFHRVTNHEYNSSGHKVGQGKVNPVDLQLMINDIGERLVEYISIALFDEAKRMYQACTGSNTLPSKMTGSQDDTSMATVDLITQLLQQEFKALSKQLSHEERKYDKLQKENEELWNKLQFLSAKKKTIEQLNDELYETLKGLSEQLIHEKRQYEKLEKEQDELLNRFSQQLSKEKNLFKNERDEMHRRLSEELSHVKELFGKTYVEKEEYLNRLSQQLGEEKNKYEQLKNETEEMHNSDGMVSGRKATDDEQQQSSDDMVAGRKPTFEGSQDTDDMVAGKKPTCEGRQETDNEAHKELGLIRRILKPICDEVLHADTDEMETIQMAECLRTCLKERNGWTQQDTPHDNQQQQLKYKREAWM